LDEAKRERDAANERAARLADSDAGHQKLVEKLETCDLGPGWDVPVVLYERLSRPAPGN
jgi:hypothetical protein